MSLTLYTHFVGDLNLPNTAVDTTIDEALQIMITRHEKQYLRDILGYAEYKNVIDNIADVSGIYYDLLNGAEYTDTQGKTQYWDGFKTVGYNPIACYIYWHIMKDNATSTTGTGEFKPLPENMENALPDTKMVGAWNMMVEMNLKLHAYLYANSDDFPEYIGLTYPPVRSSIYACMDNQFLFLTVNTFGI